MIQVLVADDHPVVRAGIVGMLESSPDITVVAQVANGRDALAALKEIPVDVILTDLRMPLMDGADLTEAVTRLEADIPVVVLTTYDSDKDILRAVEAGAVGYLLKDAPREQIVEGIRSASAGYASLSPRVAAALVSKVRHPTPDSLTRRESEILSLVAGGATNPKIARQLGISLGTVKTHLEHAYAKLEVADRASAVAKALALGCISQS